MSVAPETCPKCNTEGTFDPKSERRTSFSVGKAVVGHVLLGPVGIAAGVMGKKKVKYQCRFCGYEVEK